VKLLVATSTSREEHHGLRGIIIVVALEEAVFDRFQIKILRDHRQCPCGSRAFQAPLQRGQRGVSLDALRVDG